MLLEFSAKVRRRNESIPKAK